MQGKREQTPGIQCSDTLDSVVNDGSGLNTIGIFCQPNENVPDFPTDFEWPTCVRETECTQLPIPSEESRLQKSPKIGDSVKIGEKVRYICIDKNDYHETPEVSFLRHSKYVCTKLFLKEILI